MKAIFLIWIYEIEVKIVTSCGLVRINFMTHSNFEQLLSEHIDSKMVDNRGKNIL